MTTMADVIGDVAANGSPEAVRGVARQMSDVAETSDTIARNLAALHGARWTGAAADAYRSIQEQHLPPELAKVTRSFHEASSTLSTWAGQLEDAQHRAAQLAQQRDQAASEAAAHARERDAAMRTIIAANTRRITTIADPVAHAHNEHTLAVATDAHARASGQCDAANQRVQGVDKQIADLHKATDDAGWRCSEALTQASRDGIANGWGSNWDRWVAHGVPGAVVTDIAQFVAKSAKLAEELGDLAIHHDKAAGDRFLDAYSQWVDAAKPIVNAVVLVAVVVGAVLLVVGTDGFGLAAVPGLITIAEDGTLVTRYLDGSKTLADTILYVDGSGKRSLQQVETDGADFGLDFVAGKANSKASSLGATKGWKNQELKDLAAGDKSSLKDSLNKLKTAQSTPGADPRSVAAYKGWVTQRVKAVQASDLNHIVVDKVTDVETDHIHDQVNHLVADLQAPSGPVAGPFDGIAQGPGAQIRVTAPATTPTVVVAPTAAPATIHVAAAPPTAPIMVPAP